ncbi:hypothetical protein DL98DRAFT_564875 [Cadophora sp. DSE1049]|nr:hypothetical protein DL98DRAFT_564875 [Cadophora sp. DSE1049]
MEKIKNILKPGKSQDDEALYGTEQSAKHLGGLTGEGSHLGGTTNTSDTTNPISASGQHNTGVGNTSTGLGGQNLPSGTALGTTGGQTTQSGHHSGQGSHLASATSGGPTHTTGVTTTTTTQTHTGQSQVGRDAGLAGATAGGTGLPHESHGQHSGHGASGTTSGPHTSDLANRADPRVDSDNSRYPTQSGPQTSASQGGLGNAQIGGQSGSIGQSALSSLTGNSTGSVVHSGPTQTGSTPRHVPGEWIDETDTSRYAGTGTSDTNTGSGSHVGRDTAALGAAGVVGSGVHGQRETYRGFSSTTGSSDLAHTSQTGPGAGYSGSQQGTSTSTDQHLGRDAALVGGAGAVGSGIHNHQDHGRDSGYSGTGQIATQHSTGAHGPHTTDTANLLDPSVNTRGTSGYESAHHHSPTQGGGAEEADSHHGRNSAIGAGAGSAAAAGLVAHQHGQHQNDRGTGVGTTGSSGVGHSAGLDPTRGTGVGTATGASQSSTGPAPHTVGPHSKDWQNVADPRINTNNAAGQAAQAQTGTHSTADSSGHHYGRDAAIEAGTVGAAGLAGSQYQKHQAGSDVGASNTTGTHQTTSGLTSGPAPNTAGPHSSDMLNKLDPRVTANPTVAQGNPQAQSVLSQSDKSHAATGGYAAQPSSSHQKDYNYGKDAALTGGATSAFVGHHQGESTDPSRVHGASTTSQDPYSTGSTQGSTMDPTTDRSKDHHYSRDAAVAGGVGTAAYAAGRHHNQGESTDPSRVHGASTTSQDPYSTSSTQRSTVDPTTTDRSKDHHYGRDAAVAGGAAGVGGAAYEADKHNREKELAKAQKAAEKEHKHDLKQAEKDHKHDIKRAEKQAEKDHKKDVKEAEKDDKHQEKKKGGFLSFLHRDKGKKYSAEEEAEFDRQEREHNAAQQSHTGRNAALGGAAVAGAGAGAYASDKHHDADTNKSLPTAPGNHGVGTGEGTQNALAGAGHTSGTHGHHDDATHGTPLPLKPAGNDIGDKLHGVERNRGVTGAAGFPDQPGFGDGTTGRQHSVSEATTDQEGRPVGSGATGAGYGSQQAGREFPLGHSKHDSGYTDKTSPTHATSQHQSGHHTGRDAAALGGAALVGEHEYRKHDTTTGHQSGLAGSQGHSGLSGNQSSSGYQSVLDPGRQTGTSTGQQDYRQHDTTSGYQTGRETSGLSSTGQHHDTSTGSSGLTGSKTSDLSGRNRLHKDPPSSHPASQAYLGGDHKGAHVPASGADRERLVEQGKSDLDRDTGVASAPPANSSTNY